MTHTYETNVHFQKSFMVLDEIFRTHANFPELPQDFTYVDLGCAPGGFSGFLTSDERCAQGVGYTLALDLGGFPVLVSDPRLTVHYTDLLSGKASEARNKSQVAKYLLQDAK